MKNYVLKGNICYSRSKDELCIVENGYVVFLNMPAGHMRYSQKTCETVRRQGPVFSGSSIAVRRCC